MFGLALKPLIRLALTFAIVWFYQGLTTGFVDGIVQVLVVAALAIPTYIVVARSLFPRDGDGGRFERFGG